MKLNGRTCELADAVLHGDDLVAAAKSDLVTAQRKVREAEESARVRRAKLVDWLGTHGREPGTVRILDPGRSDGRAVLYRYMAKDVPPVIEEVAVTRDPRGRRA